MARTMPNPDVLREFRQPHATRTTPTTPTRHGTPIREAQSEIEDSHCPRRACWPAGGGCWLFDTQRCPFPVMTAQQQSGPYSLPPTHSALFRSPRPLLYVLEEAKVSVKALVRPVG